MEILTGDVGLQRVQSTIRTYEIQARLLRVVLVEEEGRGILKYEAFCGNANS